MKRKTSAYISLGICIVCCVILAVSVFTFPMFIRWLYYTYHDLENWKVYGETVIRTVIRAYYCCVPFAAGSLYMLIRLLLNILRDKVFISRNVTYFRFISWCCYAVLLITGIFGLFYFPLWMVAVPMGIVGTMLRVVKNMMQSAVELREENELTI